MSSWIRLAALGGAVAAVALASAVAIRKYRKAEPEHPPAVLRDGAGRTVYLDFHLRHTRADPPVAFFKAADGRPSIALTFDCAWVEEPAAMRILEFLEENGIRATFFISGPFVFADYRKGVAGGLNLTNLRIIRRMIEGGHEFGSHTVTHPHNEVGVDWEWENAELRRGWGAIAREAFGEDPLPATAAMLPLWRAPYGEYDDRSLRMASRAGFPIQVGWSVDVHDGLGLTRCGEFPTEDCLDPKRMTDRVLAAAERGPFVGLVVLAHLQNPYDWSGTPDGLARLVEAATERGVRFRPFSEIFDWSLAPDVVRLSGAQPSP